MTADFIRLLFSLITIVPPFIATTLQQRFAAFFHKRSYKSLPESKLKNVVVIGGSFAGWQAVKRFTETLPTGYRVILVEKNSHLNYLFAFPRFSVVKGYEQLAFIPYSGLGKGRPQGIFHHVQDTAVEVTEKYVELKSGERLDYEYLVIATGTSSALPSKMASTESKDAQGELRGMQERIEAAKRIAVVGGGAVGIELVSDIKTFYPDKEVAIIHSRDRLMNTFGPRLGDTVRKELEDIGVAVLLNERPDIPKSAQAGSLKLLNDKEEHFDLIIPCIGQRPNSSLISTLSPLSISKESSHILVNPTLQLSDQCFPRVYAFGDVAATGGPKMGRAAYIQSEVVVQNVCAMIRGETKLRTYKPKIMFEGSIKLTLGKSRVVLHLQEESGREIIVALNMEHVDMDAPRQWKAFGAGAELSTLERAKKVDV